MDTPHDIPLFDRDDLAVFSSVSDETWIAMQYYDPNNLGSDTPTEVDSSSDSLPPDPSDTTSVPPSDYSTSDVVESSPAPPQLHQELWSEEVPFEFRPDNTSTSDEDNGVPSGASLATTDAEYEALLATTDPEYETSSVEDNDSPTESDGSDGLGTPLAHSTDLEKEEGGSEADSSNPESVWNNPEWSVNDIGLPHDPVSPQRRAHWVDGEFHYGLNDLMEDLQAFRVLAQIPGGLDDFMRLKYWRKIIARSFALDHTDTPENPESVLYKGMTHMDWHNLPQFMDNFCVPGHIPHPGRGGLESWARLFLEQYSNDERPIITQLPDDDEADFADDEREEAGFVEDDDQEDEPELPLLPPSPSPSPAVLTIMSDEERQLAEDRPSSYRRLLDACNWEFDENTVEERHYARQADCPNRSHGVVCCQPLPFDTEFETIIAEQVVEPSLKYTERRAVRLRPLGVDAVDTPDLQAKGGHGNDTSLFLTLPAELRVEIALQIPRWRDFMAYRQIDRVNMDCLSDERFIRRYGKVIPTELFEQMESAFMTPNVFFERLLYMVGVRENLPWYHTRRLGCGYHPMDNPFEYSQQGKHYLPDAVGWARFEETIHHNNMHDTLLKVTSLLAIGGNRRAWFEAQDMENVGVAHPADLEFLQRYVCNELRSPWPTFYAIDDAFCRFREELFNLKEALLARARMDVRTFTPEERISFKLVRDLYRLVRDITSTSLNHIPRWYHLIEGQLSLDDSPLIQFTMRCLVPCVLWLADYLVEVRGDVNRVIGSFTIGDLFSWLHLRQDLPLFVNRMMDFREFTRYCDLVPTI